MIEPEEFRTQTSDFERFALLLEQKALRDSLLAFVRAAWPVVEPSQPFIENWHIVEICKVLEQVTKKRLRRVIINVPPGTLKSLLVSVFWPAWMWARDPKKRFLTTAYGAHLTIRDNLRVRDIVVSPWFQRLFPMGLVEDQNTKTRFNTAEGGWRIASSVGGAAIGEHPDVIIIDDALTPTQAESEPERTACNNWYDRTISPRGVARGAVIIVIAQRLHEDDLPGYLLRRGGWEHVCFPMRYECTRAASEDQAAYTADPRDPRTVEGELLLPQLFDEEKVRQLELDLGPYGTAGQLQQHPAPEGGGLFKREWFKYLDVMPKTVLRRVRGWDTAATAGGGDFTVGAKLAEVKLGTDDAYVLEDVQRDQLSPNGVDVLMRATAEADGRKCGQREEKEGGASGKAVVQARAKLLRGYDYSFTPVSGSKVTRAKPFRSQCEAGNVYLLRGPWNEVYIRELCGFPTGQHDDQVDASSTAFNALLLEPKRRKVRSSW